MILDKKLPYAVQRIGRTSDRVTNGKIYVARWREVSRDHSGPISAWVIDVTDDPTKNTQPSLPGQTAWKVICPATKFIEGYRWFKKIQTSPKNTGAALNSVVKIDCRTRKATNDSPTRQVEFSYATLNEGSPFWVELTHEDISHLNKTPKEGRRYFIKYATEGSNGYPVGTVIVTENGKSTPDSPTKWTGLVERSVPPEAYWKEISEAEYNERPITDEELAEFMSQTPTTTKEPTMATPTKVETVTQINGENADRLSSNDIIAKIKNEQVSIECLLEVKVDSEYIKKQISEHEASIAALVAILDAR